MALLRKRLRKKSKEQRPSFVDLCCGSGGMSHGFRRAGWMPLFGVDNCAHSATTYRKNLKVTAMETDLSSPGAHRQIRAQMNGTTPEAVIAGPPCQGFSRAGPRKLRDPRNELLVACARGAGAL